MAGIGRNKPCPCNSGKKYKKCCGDRRNAPRIHAPFDIAAIDRARRQAEALRTRRLQQQGLGRPILSAPVSGERVVVVGKRLYHSRKWVTFHDFLRDYLLGSLGADWSNAEQANALADRLAFGSLDVEPNGWLRLTDAMKAVGGREKPWGPAFAIMLDEKSLPFFWRGRGELSRIIAEDIFVSLKARDRLQTIEFFKADYPEFKFDDFLTVRDATRLLNIHDTKFPRIRQLHFAGAVTADGRVAKRAVIDAARDWISPGELGARTGRTPHECFTELYRTDLPRTLLGWPRTDAERHMKLRASDR